MHTKVMSRTRKSGRTHVQTPNSHCATMSSSQKAGSTKRASHEREFKYFEVVLKKSVGYSVVV